VKRGTLSYLFFFSSQSPFVKTKTTNILTSSLSHKTQKMHGPNSAKSGHERYNSNRAMGKSVQDHIDHTRDLNTSFSNRAWQEQHLNNSVYAGVPQSALPTWPPRRGAFDHTYGTPDKKKHHVQSQSHLYSESSEYNDPNLAYDILSPMYPLSQAPKILQRERLHTESDGVHSDTLFGLVEPSLVSVTTPHDTVTDVHHLDNPEAETIQTALTDATRDRNLNLKRHANNNIQYTSSTSDTMEPNIYHKCMTACRGMVYDLCYWDQLPKDRNRLMYSCTRENRGPHLAYTLIFFMILYWMLCRLIN
jgi:hypothetical protein